MMVDKKANDLLKQVLTELEKNPEAHIDYFLQQAIEQHLARAAMEAPDSSDPLRLYELVSISNNSRITQSVCQALNEKLNSRQMHDFKRWLRELVHKG